MFLGRESSSESTAIEKLEQDVSKNPGYQSLTALQKAVDFLNDSASAGGGNNQKATASLLAQIEADDRAAGRKTIIESGQGGKLDIKPAAELVLRADASYIELKNQARFHQNISDLDTRTNLKQPSDSKQLSNTEVAQAEESLVKLLEGADKTIDIGAASRALAAEGVLEHAAKYKGTRQGRHNTCPATALEHELFVEQPALVAQMVASAALTGQWTGRDGKLINVHPEYFKPGPEESKFPPANGERSFATQILNLTMLNDMGQHLKENLSYIEEPGAKGGAEQWVLPNGTRIPFTLTSTEAKKIRNFPIAAGVLDLTAGPPDWQVSQELTRLTGKQYGIIRNKAHIYNDIPKGDEPSGGEKDGDIYYVGTVKELDDHLKYLKAHGGLPILASVEALMLVQQMGIRVPRNPTPGEPPNHIITIDDYQPAQNGEPAQLLVHNQWEDRFDGWISLPGFFEAQK